MPTQDTSVILSAALEKKAMSDEEVAMFRADANKACSVLRDVLTKKSKALVGSLFTIDGLVWGSQAYIAGKAKNPPLNIRCRSSIEPVIAHTKHDHRLGRNYRLGAKGDGVYAVMSGAGFNFRKLMVTLSIAINRALERFSTFPVPNQALIFMRDLRVI